MLIDDILARNPGNYEAALRAAIVIDVSSARDAALDFEIHGPGDNYFTVLENLPCCLPPFPRTFAFATTHGVLIDSSPVGPGWLLQLQWWHRRDGRILRALTTEAILLAQDGTVSPDLRRYEWRDTTSSVPRLQFGRDEPTKFRVAMRRLFFVLFALSCIHCKQFTLRPTVPSAKLQAARRRRGKPPLVEYRVLEIDQLSREMQSAAETATEPGERNRRRLHVVRRHAMRTHGQVVWREAHWRGDPAMGFIDKGYTLPDRPVAPAPRTL